MEKIHNLEGATEKRSSLPRKPTQRTVKKTKKIIQWDIQAKKAKVNKN